MTDEDEVSVGMKTIDALKHSDKGCVLVDETKQIA